MPIIKTIYMESTIKYFKEVYGSSTSNEISNHIKKGIPKVTSNGIRYILVIDEEENFTPAA